MTQLLRPSFEKPGHSGSLNLLSGTPRAGCPYLPRYEFLSELGRGGMGVVYKARKRFLNRLVAVKVLLKEDNDPDIVRRFSRETWACAQLSHPNVVTVFDAGETPDCCYMEMEYVAGQDLQRRVDEKGPLPVEEACDYVRQTALGLQHAHERGLVHRDVKPSNLLVTKGSPFGTIKLLDLGLASIKAEGEDVSRMTHDGIIIGTPDFIAPEQIEDSHAVDIRADLYSLGCTFYFLLTGRTPFAGKSLLMKLDQHRYRRPQGVDLIRPEIPPAVARVVHKLLAKNPAERYQTPLALATALEAIMVVEEDQSALSRAETKNDFSLETARPKVDRRVRHELDKLQAALVERIEQNEMREALELVEEMIQLAPADSLALSARAFVQDHLERALPVGE